MTTKQIIDITGVTDEGSVLHMPQWLSDESMPAPCPCGRPMDPDEPWILREGETGLKQLLHLECAGGNIFSADDDD